MRGKFNTTCDIFRGPGTTTPGFFVGTFPCRLVIEDAINTVGVGAPYIHRYMTIDGYKPRGAWTSAKFGMDPELSDQIAVPSGSDVRWWVLYTDIVEWHALTPYWRSYLVELPLPEGPGLGGVIVNAAGILEFHHSFPSDGGAVVNGSANAFIAKNYTGSGGVVVDSFADWSKRHWKVGSGGVKVDSGGTYHKAFSLIGNGGVLVNYYAEWFFQAYFAQLGGLLLNNAADWDFTPGSGSGSLHGLVVASTSATPMVLTVTSPTGGAPGLVTGDVCLIAGLTTNPSLNGVWTITRPGGPSTLAITLDGSTATGLNGSEGGTWVKL